MNDLKLSLTRILKMGHRNTVLQKPSFSLEWSLPAFIRLTENLVHYLSPHSVIGLIMLKGSLCSISHPPFWSLQPSLSTETTAICSHAHRLWLWTSLVPRDEINEETSKFSLLWAQHLPCVGKISCLMASSRHQGYEDDCVINIEIHLLINWWNHSCSIKGEGVLTKQSFSFLKMQRSFFFAII